MRKDSPTAEIEAHNLLFSFAAATKLILRTADISNAYFQGEELDRLLLLKPPRGGVPQTKVSYFQQADLKGLIPKFLVNSTIVFGLGNIRNLRKKFDNR